ncbi:Outer membrane protein assembly factor YaeT [hydrothermal vent metagenome]|uniref:Outer membrane protein assembly factor YaeT n=1 Tax=hydrothermal vent metagenome TaxID=652676 RepID=A0A3B0RKJ8_9ZZZZ
MIFKISKDYLKKLTSRMGRLTLILAIFFALSIPLLTLSPKDALAKAPGNAVKVVIMPFAINSLEDISQERKELMEHVASALDESGAAVTGMKEVKRLFLKKGITRFTEKEALNIARKSGAEFAIIGSLALLGETYSANWRILKIKDSRLLRFYHRSSPSLGTLTSEVSATSESMLKRMMQERGDATKTIKTDELAAVTVKGNRRMDDEGILRNIKSRAGKKFSAEDVKDDIYTIYSMGYFDDVIADLKETGEGLTLNFKVAEKPFVKSVTVTGNKHMGQDKLDDMMTIKENTILDNTATMENAEMIRILYIQDGYYLANITPEITVEGLDATVTFHVKEGPKVKIQRITLIGNKAFSSRKLKKILKTKEASPISFVTGSGSFNEYNFELDTRKLMNYYYDRGYMKAKIIDKKVLLSEDKKWFYITIAITEGDRYRIGSVEIEGDIVTDKKNILKALDIKPKSIFDRSELKEGIEALTELYGDKGFANADFNTQTDLDMENKTIALTIVIKKGVPVYIERIGITGNTRTRDKVIRRELEFAEGDLFSSTELKESRKNLKRLGYFESVEIEKSPGATSNRLKLDVDVVEQPTGAISFGLGYSTFEKVITNASISQANFLGTGLKLNLNGTISAKSSNYVLGITEPWLFNKPLSAGIDLFDTKKKYPDFSVDRQGINLRFGFPIWKRTTRGYITYRYEQTDVTDVAADASKTIRDQDGKSTVSSITPRIKHDSRDDIFFPTEGKVISFSTEFAGSFLGGSKDYVKHEASAATFIAMPLDTVFSVRGILGHAYSLNSDEEVPIYEKYYLGGINSLRGYESRSVGTKDSVTGEILGGDTKILLNTEIVFPILPQERFRGVVFFDIGNAFDGSFNVSDLRKGAGVGIRWFSPMGPIRLEWGFNLDQQDDEEGSVWEFTIGSMF